MAKPFYTGTDAELVAGSLNFATLIAANPLQYGLSVPQATAYGTLNTAYANSYNTANDPSTRTTVSVATKNQARVNLVANARLLASAIDLTPTVTVAMKLALGITVKAPPTPTPVPATAPSLDVISVVGRTVKIRVHDMSMPKKTKPPGTVNATLFSFVGAVAPAGLSGWKFEGVTTRAIFDVNFSDTVPGGAQVWLTAYWSNARAETGPVSDPISTNLQGGGVSKAA